jgi:hypothetical protein
MPDAESTDRFVMYGARAVLDAGAVHIEQQISALESAVMANAGLVFDLAKTLIESACKTVLSERKFDYDGGWDLPRLLKETLGQLRLVPEGLDGDQEVSDSLRKTAGGLQTAIQGICELRNTHGFASHGREAAFQQLESVQALLVARSSDAIVNFLFRVHRNYQTAESIRPRTYDDQAEFNQYVDELHEPVRIFNEEFEPSKILFEMAPEPYRIYLAGFQLEQQEEEGSTSGDKPPESSR